MIIAHVDDDAFEKLAIPMHGIYNVEPIDRVDMLTLACTVTDMYDIAKKVDHPIYFDGTNLLVIYFIE